MGKFSLEKLVKIVPKVVDKIPGIISTIGHCKGKQYGKCLEGVIGHVGDASDILGSLRKGGRINKTGVYRLHKGELVLTPAQSKKVMVALKKKRTVKTKKH